MNVSVLIDLHQKQAVGGHVKSWLQFAQAAIRLADQNLHLTLHFLGDRDEEIARSNQVSFVYHRPKFSTSRLPFLRDVPSDTDLASYNAALLPYLDSSDIVHVTHPLFTFGQTAQRYCQKTGKPLVCSFHTDAPLYAKRYLEEKLQKIFGSSWINQVLTDKLLIPERYRVQLEQKQRRYWQQCRHVWVGTTSEMEVLRTLLPSEKCSYLRRGLDSDTFYPQKANRQSLAEKYQIPADFFWALFVGRLDACKNVMTFVKAIHQLQQEGYPVHAILVGKGSDLTQIQAILGDGGSCLGTLPHQELSIIYASSDAFVFPSETETMANVVIEARASGLPVVVSDHPGSSQHVRQSGVDGLVVSGQTPQVWADHITRLYENRDLRNRMGQCAYQLVQETWPTWDTVFKEDLLPIWQTIARS